MIKFTRHYDPLRPNRALGIADRYEFTHGRDSVCVYDIDKLDFIKEIPVGVRPDCHSTSCDNKYLYIACIGGLYIIGQDSLRVEKIIDTGSVYGTNVLPDGSTMLLHDCYGGIIILKDIQDMEKIHIHKRLDILELNIYRQIGFSNPNEYGYMLGGKGNLIENGRYYLCNAWNDRRMFIIDLENDYSFDVYMDNTQEFHNADDLVINAEKTKAYSACYCNRESCYITVTDIEKRQIIKTIPTLRGTCGLTMSNDERYCIASNDLDNAISVIDTHTDTLVRNISADEGFRKLGITGCIQGLSVGMDDEIYVYGCSGNGAIVRFSDIYTSPRWTISYSGGKLQTA